LGPEETFAGLRLGGNSSVKARPQAAALNISVEVYP
jgi:hypothetical protein